MEHYAHAVAELDACRITRGGLFLDTAHTDQLQDFARAYRALPAEKFETVGRSTDPVAVRTLVRDGRRYLYLVNRDYHPVAVELQLDGAGRATDLAASEAIDAPARWQLTLGPYQLRSFALDPERNILGFEATVPGEIVAQLKSKAQEALKQVAQIRSAGVKLPVGTDRMVAGIKAAIQEGRSAWLRRALTSYIIRKCEQLAAASNQSPQKKAR
jgi:hypothetical protein